jgi:hypothetical protein
MCDVESVCGRGGGGGGGGGAGGGGGGWYPDRRPYDFSHGQNTRGFPNVDGNFL